MTGPHNRRWVALAGPLVVASLLTGCGTSSSPAISSAVSSGAPAASTAPGPASSAGPTSSSGPTSPAPAAPGPVGASMTTGVAVTALDAQIAVYSGPEGPVTQTFSNPQPSGAPMTFLRVAPADCEAAEPEKCLGQQDGDWLQVYLPVRPNGSTGWVRTTDVTQATIPYRIEISTAAHQLQLYQGSQLLQSYPAATGTGGTPTPLGLFYLTELLAPTNTGYGPYAYGLSGFSEVLTSFGGGPGQIGLHGTDDAASIGTSTSHGCIRLANPNITALAELLPLGTPVRIT